MTDKFKLPLSANSRRDVSTTKDGHEAENTTATKHENKHQGTVEKQKLEQIKNAGEVIKLARGIMDIVKIRESTNSQLTIIDAKMKQMETEARTYIQKLEAESSLFIVKGQVATSIIQAISDLINKSDDLDSTGKLEAIRSISSLMSSIMSKSND